jgi:hypothetical protein
MNAIHFRSNSHNERHTFPFHSATSYPTTDPT